MNDDRTLDMFERIKRRSRRTDPPTSHLAAARQDARINAQVNQVLALIECFPGHTACELAKRATKTTEEYVRMRYMISRRAAELRNAGLVRSGAARECTVAGSNQMTWYPA